MEEDIRFGRIAGIAVGASWSLIVVVLLITWTVAVGVLPAGDVDYPAGVYWAVAAVTALVFLASLLAHEMAHALVAKAQGMPVEGITLWMFGGVSKLGGDAPDARSELRMAIVGPLTSLVIGIVLLVAAVAADAAGGPEVAALAIGWLGIMNVALAIFNMLPAYPLDGGRVLRSVLWLRSGDQRRATIVASQAGVAFGYGLMALGAVGFIGGMGIGGIWLVFLGWIVLEAARAERTGFELRTLLRTTRVADVMTRNPVTVPTGLSVDDLVHDYVAQHRCSSFPVVRPDGAPVGLVTLSGVRDVDDRVRATTQVDAVARPIDEIVTAHPDDRVIDVLPRFTARTGRRALVTDAAGVLVGILSASDVDRALAVAEARAPAAPVPPPPPPPPPAPVGGRR
ncbi:MAG TPA: site-2 protease family protein [Acidimicrobiales bacterium]